MKIFITGGNGFVGSWLLQSYLEKHPEYELFGLKRRRSDMANVEHIMDKINWIEGDITDAHSVNAMIQELKPDILHQTAAQSYVHASWKYPLETLHVNIDGTLNLFEAIRKYCPFTKIQLCGSSEEYGTPLKDDEGQWILPLNEDSPLNPMSPYAVSKCATTLLGRQYHKSYGLQIFCTRAFNHTGPRRGKEFVTYKITRQAAEIKLGLRKNFVLGNLDAMRDFTDVRDIVNAYMNIFNAKPGEIYVLASGKAYSVKELVEIVGRLAGISPQVEQDPNLLRPSDVPILLGDARKAKTAIGWEPKILLEKTLEDMILWQLDQMK